MSKALNGKVAIVTGASKGLGRAISTGLVAAGAKVGLLARSRPELEALAGELGPSAAPFQCDLRSPDAIRAAFTGVADHFGGIDILVNNAVMVLLDPIQTISDEDARCQVETNLLAPLMTCREAVPHMLKRGAGHIINVSSESVGHAFPFLATYVATKAGLEGLSTALRVELANRNIRVGIFRSGFMGESASSAQWTEENKKAFYEAMHETGLDKFAGEAIPLEVQADALISMLTLPPQANIDHMTVRASR